LYPASRPNKGAPRSLVFDGGAEKTLTIFGASPLRLSFFLCPQTPADQCERYGFRFAEGTSWRGHGGRSERRRLAVGQPVLSERSPPSQTKLPRSACIHARSGVEITACVLNLHALNPPRALSKYTFPRWQRAPCMHRKALPVWKCTPTHAGVDFLAARNALLHVREAVSSKEMDVLTHRLVFSSKEKGSQLL
jgi:hypothetical protein